MSNINKINELLEDIASYILLLHRTYIEELSYEYVLAGLLSFLSDYKLLDTHISILEAHVCKISCSVEEISEPHSNLPNSMSCENFYVWLNKIASIIYKPLNNTDGWSLQQLLVNHIYPISITLNATSINKNLELFKRIDPEILKSMSEFKAFFKISYSAISSKVCCIFT